MNIPPPRSRARLQYMRHLIKAKYNPLEMYRVARSITDELKPRRTPRSTSIIKLFVQYTLVNEIYDTLRDFLEDSIKLSAVDVVKYIVSRTAPSFWGYFYDGLNLIYLALSLKDKKTAVVMVKLLGAKIFTLDKTLISRLIPHILGSIKKDHPLALRNLQIILENFPSAEIGKEDPPPLILTDS